MFILLSPIWRKAGLLMAHLALAAFLSFSCTAQDRGRGRLPDSISTDIDSTTPPPESPATVGTSDVSPPAGSSRQDSAMEKPDSAVFRAVPDSDFAAYRQDPEFAYAYDSAYWRRRQLQNEPTWFDRALGSAFWKYFIYTIFLGLLAFGLYRIIADNGLYLFYRSPKKAVAGSGEVDDPDLADEDLETRIQDAEKTGNFRLATRYLFIKTLRLMDAQDLIRYQAKATNEDYIRQLGAHAVSDRFRYLARAYEHVWYGGFALNESQYGQLNRYFQDFYSTITT